MLLCGVDAMDGDSVQRVLGTINFALLLLFLRVFCVLCLCVCVCVCFFVCV